MEKPTNVLIAEAIGRKSESSTDGRWRVNHVVTDAGGTVHEMWIHPPPYDTDPASAWSALEAWRSSQPFRDYKVASGESVHGGWCGERLISEAEIEGEPRRHYEGVILEVKETT